MKIKHSINTAVNGLMTHKSRSMLTILGIVIGVASIILIMSLGQEAKNLILGEIQGQVGSKVIEIRPGKQGPGPSAFLQLFSDSLKPNDLEALKKKENVPNATGIMPLVMGSALATFGSESYLSTLYGMTELASNMYYLKVEEGRFLTDDDVKSYASVAVIGSKIREKLFKNESEVIGQKIKLKGRIFKVIGILPEGGQGIAIFDETIIVPYTTAQQYILGYKYFQHIIVEADTEANVKRVAEDITITLRNSHNITDPDKDNFTVQTQADALKMVDSIMSILALFITAIAAISLVVGGVGIMNIMLVSVTERTKEIGLRKALGATHKDILIQFLLEAVILTTAGGIIGIIFGSTLSLLISFAINTFTSFNWSFSFPFGAAVLGIGVSSAIGLIFGIYPANQAAKKSPMEALRYE